MDTVSFVTHLARVAEIGARRIVEGLRGPVLLALVVLGLSCLIGFLAADLLGPSSDDVFAAPFRWRT